MKRGANHNFTNNPQFKRKKLFHNLYRDRNESLPPDIIENSYIERERRYIINHLINDRKK